MTKYQKYFQEMMNENTELFTSFKQIHEQYAQDPDTCREQFNTEGQKVVDIIRTWERLLCAKSEGGQYGKFSAKLSEKFWDAIRGYYPKIDFVGTR
jgi:hypothetical protein